jgi:hypothetical protein
MSLALNVFRTVTTVVPTSPIELYTAPVGYTGVVLLAQAANIGTDSQDITFLHQRTSTGIAVTTSIVRNYPISGNDTLNVLQGKLVLESGDTLIVFGSTSTDLEVITSILETLN